MPNQHGRVDRIQAGWPSTLEQGAGYGQAIWKRKEAKQYQR